MSQSCMKSWPLTDRLRVYFVVERVTKFHASSSGYLLKKERKKHSVLQRDTTASRIHLQPMKFAIHTRFTLEFEWDCHEMIVCIMVRKTKCTLTLQVWVPPKILFWWCEYHQLHVWSYLSACCVLQTHMLLMTNPHDKFLIVVAYYRRYSMLSQCETPCNCYWQIPVISTNPSSICGHSFLINFTVHHGSSKNWFCPTRQLYVHCSGEPSQLCPWFPFG